MSELYCIHLPGICWLVLDLCVPAQHALPTLMLLDLGLYAVICVSFRFRVLLLCSAGARAGSLLWAFAVLLCLPPRQLTLPRCPPRGSPVRYELLKAPGTAWAPAQEATDRQRPRYRHTQESVPRPWMNCPGRKLGGGSSDSSALAPELEPGAQGRDMAELRESTRRTPQAEAAAPAAAARRCGRPTATHRRISKGVASSGARKPGGPRPRQQDQTGGGSSRAAAPVLMTDPPRIGFRARRLLDGASAQRGVFLQCYRQQAPR
ncbi:hypothetical protein NDU88_006898 [Pleurodeles waltl]|uniref:Uncharacterized protein n=1 Tax=Pleurodeles waltl TaxID=8319 RepID=A0AAV7RSI7_PLEWA|nr:hypothetical protein NDU88_006898 [Pleurodeles waltl]